jgi:hypothetical protein
VLTLAGRAAPDDLVATQGHVLRVDDLLATLVVEATTHHLDMVIDLDHPGPRAEPLALTRGTLDGLVGRSTPGAWRDQQWLLAAPGRGALTDAQIAFLGSDIDRLPLLR